MHPALPMHPASVTCLKYYRYGLKRYPINQSTFASGEYEVWCMENSVFDLIIGEVENARKPHDPDSYRKPLTVSTVERRQQVRNKQKPYPSLTVQEIIQDYIRPDDTLQVQQVDPSLDKECQYAREDRVSRDCEVKWIEKKGLVYREYEAPKGIPTNLGGQFTSGLMKGVSRLISLKQLPTTPYHQMYNG